jgi:type II secretory pathway component PulM
MILQAGPPAAHVACALWQTLLGPASSRFVRAARVLANLRRLARYLNCNAQEDEGSLFHQFRRERNVFWF